MLRGFQLAADQVQLAAEPLVAACLRPAGL